jgi:ABC-type glycerol-3-phosphate transport system substrate-binding protein
MSTLPALTLSLMVAAACAGAPAPAQAQYQPLLKFEPAQPTSAQPVVAHISGYYSSAGFRMATDPKVTVAGPAITIELVALPPGGMAAQVMTPFTVAVPVGTLAVGSYTATVKLSIQNLPVLPQLGAASLKVVAP